jgi:hypothetical protein
MHTYIHICTNTYNTRAHTHIHTYSRTGVLNSGLCACKTSLLKSRLSGTTFLCLFFIVLGVHCGIYKSSYNKSNISYLNSPPPSFSFTLFPPFLQSFQQVSLFHLHACIHSTCTIFTRLHPFPASFSFPLVPIPPDKTCSDFLFSAFVKEKKMTF